MVDMHNDVKKFHEVFEQRIGYFPAFPIEKERSLRKALLKEEYEEYLKAEEENDLIEVSDALTLMC